MGYKKTTIIEAKDLKTLKLDALVGSLLTHEIMKKEREEEKKKEEVKIEKREVEKKSKRLLLKLHVHKKKWILVKKKS